MQSCICWTPSTDKCAADTVRMVKIMGTKSHPHNFLTGNSLRQVDIWVLLIYLLVSTVGIFENCVWSFLTHDCVSYPYKVWGRCVLMLWGLTHPLGPHSWCPHFWSCKNMHACMCVCVQTIDLSAMSREECNQLLLRKGFYKRSHADEPVPEDFLHGPYRPREEL